MLLPPRSTPTTIRPSCPQPLLPLYLIWGRLGLNLGQGGGQEELLAIGSSNTHSSGILFMTLL